MLFSHANRPHRRITQYALTALLALGGTTTLVTAAFAAHQTFAPSRALTMDEAQSLVARSNDGASLPIVLNDAVLERINWLLTSAQGHRFIATGLANHAAYQALVARTLNAYGLPQELAAIPLVESAYKNLAQTSRDSSLAGGPRGAGLWMFIQDTAKAFGLRVDETVDQRLDPTLETDAAARMFASLNLRYRSWPLAIAAYNYGAGRLDHLLETSGTRDPWALTPQGSEVRQYVSTYMACLFLMKNPQLVD